MFLQHSFSSYSEYRKPYLTCELELYILAACAIRTKITIAITNNRTCLVLFFILAFEIPALTFFMGEHLNVVQKCSFDF